MRVPPIRTRFAGSIETSFIPAKAEIQDARTGSEPAALDSRFRAAKRMISPF
jgi:hypothetical protein